MSLVKKEYRDKSYFETNKSNNYFSNEHKAMSAKERERYYPISIINYDNKLAISYTPISSAIGTYFVQAVHNATNILGYLANNLMGVTENHAGSARLTQVWTFSPNPSADNMYWLKALIETELKKIIKAKKEEKIETSKKIIKLRSLQ